ncbi:MAG TPA: superoxide dismutase family protein [Kofleriaceae bacterium]|nr:superoxide dismutase family protein [Kofleriaceae bacterium]
MKRLALMAVVLAACGGDDGGGDTKMASSTVSGFMGGTVTGTGMFQQGAVDTAADSVTVTINLTGCVAGKAYPVHIHTGAACTDTTAQGGHWDMTRGEGIPNISCSGTSGSTVYNRAATDATLKWSVGDGSATDVIGHTIVVHDPDMPMTRIACGTITAAAGS